MGRFSAVYLKSLHGQAAGVAHIGQLAGLQSFEVVWLEFTVSVKVVQPILRIKYTAIRQVQNGRKCWCIVFVRTLQRTLTYFIRGSIIAWLTSCLTGLDSTKLVNLYQIQHKQSRWILTSETGGQPYNDTSPNEVVSVLWTLATARLAKQLFLTPKVRSSNPIIHNC